MNWLVTKTESDTETVYVYQGAWIIYVFFMSSIVLMLASSLPIPGGRILGIIGAVLAVFWLPLLVYFIFHFRRRYQGEVVMSGHKMSRSSPLTMRVPKSRSGLAGPLWP